MINVSKQMNITSLIKFILLSLIFCIPITPVGIERDTHSLKSFSQLNVYSFLVPSNSHFEHKVLKKIPLIECPTPKTITYYISKLCVLNNSTPNITLIRTSYFITSSSARGPPIHS